MHTSAGCMNNYAYVIQKYAQATVVCIIRKFFSHLTPMFRQFSVPRFRSSNVSNLENSREISTFFETKIRPRTNSGFFREIYIYMGVKRVKLAG